MGLFEALCSSKISAISTLEKYKPSEKQFQTLKYQNIKLSNISNWTNNQPYSQIFINMNMIYFQHSSSLSNHWKISSHISKKEIRAIRNKGVKLIKSLTQTTKSLLPKSLKTISNSQSRRKCTTCKRQEINLKINDVHFIFVLVINTLMTNKLSSHLV